MKVVFLLFVFFFSNLNFSFSIKIKKDTGFIQATSYALAGDSRDTDFTKNGNHYRSVEIVDKLPPFKPISEGIIETVDEIKSESNYYDGTKGLKTINLNLCDTYTTQPKLCVGQGSCGWCGSTNTCINGNNLGPLSPCIRGTYIFTPPNDDWNPFPGATVTQVNINGARFTKIHEK